MIGKLHSIFSEAGRGGDDSTIPGYGNPATSRVVKDYSAQLQLWNSTWRYISLSVYRFRGVIFFVQLACREKGPLHLWIPLLPRAAFQLIFNSCLKFLATVELHFMY